MNKLCDHKHRLLNLKTFDVLQEDSLSVIINLHFKYLLHNIRDGDPILGPPIPPSPTAASA